MRVVGLMLLLACQKDEPPGPRPIPDEPPRPRGPVFVLADLTVTLGDASGFRSIANQVRWMDVVPDGTMWACDVWNVVRWDGKTATRSRPPFPITACAAGFDGKLWAIEGKWNVGVEQIGSFDGARWTMTPTKLGPRDGSDFDVHDFAIDRDGVIYLVSWDDDMRRNTLHSYVRGTWRTLLSGTFISQLVRGVDGHVYALHESPGKPALSRVAAGEVQTPLTVADENNGHRYPWIDAQGTWTIYDRVNGTILRAGSRTKVPAPASIAPLRKPHPNPFAVDTDGRMWLDLYDGLNVIERNGSRTVFPRGSIEGIAAPIEKIVVVNAGPTLPKPAAAVTRTITGSVTGHGTPLANAPVVACSYPSNADPPCSDETAKWTGTTDANGRYTLTGVPRFEYPIVVKYGDYWHPLRVGCCAGKTDFETIEIPR